MGNWLPEEPPDWWDEAAGFFANPKAAILGAIAGWIVTNILEPPVDWAFTFLGLLADSLLWIFLGTDKQLTYSYLDLFGSRQCGTGGCVDPGQTQSYSTEMGVAEIPLYVLDVAVESFEAPVAQLIAGVASFNKGLDATLETTVGAGLPVATVLGFVEVALVGYVILAALSALAPQLTLGGGALLSRIQGVIR